MKTWNLYLILLTNCIAPDRRGCNSDYGGLADFIASFAAQ
jgi:hypothetical protein